MKIEHLEYFTKVAQWGSINKAATQLYISQPHLSRIIKDIEEDAGTNLFYRTRSGVKLTEAGAVFLEHSLNVLNEIKALERIVHPKAQKQTMRVSMTRSSHVMESFIEVCKQHETDPSYSFFLHEKAPHDVVDDVASVRADVGVLQMDCPIADETVMRIASQGLVLHSLAVVRPHIVISENHELLRSGTPITLQALSQYGLVRYNGDYEDFAYDITVNGSKINLNDSLRVARIHGRASLLHLIASSNFYTMGIQGFDHQYAFYNIISLPIDGCEDRFEFAYIVPQERALSPIAIEFVDNLRQKFSGLSGAGAADG